MERLAWQWVRTSVTSTTLKFLLANPALLVELAKKDGYFG